MVCFSMTISSPQIHVKRFFPSQPVPTVKTMVQHPDPRNLTQNLIIVRQKTAVSLKYLQPLLYRRIPRIMHLLVKIIGSSRKIEITSVFRNLARLSFDHWIYSPDCPLMSSCLPTTARHRVRWPSDNDHWKQGQPPTGSATFVTLSPEDQEDRVTAHLTMPFFFKLIFVGDAKSY